MNLRSYRRRAAILVALMTTGALSGCMGSDDDCTTVSARSLVAAIAAPAPPPPPPRPAAPPRINPPKVDPPKAYTPPTRATNTRTTTATRTTTRAAAPPATATTAPTTKAAPAANPVALRPGKKVRALKGEKAYYPTPITKQHPTNVYLAQDSVRKQIELNGRFTKGTRYSSPVTKRTYIYHDGNSYTKDVPQDLYDPFDPRNWTHPFSPFNLSRLIILGQLVSNGPNVLNGDYRGEASASAGQASTSPSASSSPRSPNRC